MASERDFMTEREDVAYFMRRLYSQKLTTTSGGNVSVRLANNTILLTPAGLDKARLTGEQIAVCTATGEPLSDGPRPTSESKMHVQIYRNCPHVTAIVHAHPATASTFTTTSVPINIRLLAESYTLLDSPILVPYARTATDALAAAVASAACRSCCILLQNHGVTTTGQSLLQAFDRLELLEAAAQMTLLSRQLNNVNELTAEQMAELDQLAGRC